MVEIQIYYYNQNEHTAVPHYLGLFLQGFQEGGVITTIGLYFGDRIFSYNHMVGLHILISFIVLIISLIINQKKSFFEDNDANLRKLIYQNRTIFSWK